MQCSTKYCADIFVKFRSDIFVLRGAKSSARAASNVAEIILK